jgi:hypothetical protein
MLLILLGLALVVRALRMPGEKIGFGSPIRIAIVLAGIILFGVIVDQAGLVISAILLIVVTSAASSQFRWKEALLSGIILTTLSVIGFVWALRRTSNPPERGGSWCFGWRRMRLRRRCPSTAKSEAIEFSRPAIPRCRHSIRVFIRWS